MALTRKFLAAMGIEAEKIDEIISAHSETVTALKSEIGDSKDAAEKLKAVEAERDTLKAEVEKLKEGDWEKKYTDIKTEYDSYKTGVEEKAHKAKIAEAYKKLLVNAGISEKRVGAVMKVSDLSKVELNDDGTVKGAEDLTKSVKEEWSDFIVTTEEKGATTPKPPAGDGSEGQKPSRAAQLAKQYREEHYGKED